jgi:hypothetical protein
MHLPALELMALTVRGGEDTSWNPLGILSHVARYPAQTPYPYHQLVLASA